MTAGEESPTEKKIRPLFKEDCTGSSTEWPILIFPRNRHPPASLTERFQSINSPAYSLRSTIFAPTYHPLLAVHSKFQFAPNSTESLRFEWLPCAQLESHHNLRMYANNDTTDTVRCHSLWVGDFEYSRSCQERGWWLGLSSGTQSYVGYTIRGFGGVDCERDCDWNWLQSDHVIYWSVQAFFTHSCTPIWLLTLLSQSATASLLCIIAVPGVRVFIPDL